MSVQQQVIRKISSFWVIFFLLIIATSQDSFATEEKDYQVGEHLKKSEPSAAQSHEIYIKMDWDTLMPEDWDPMKPIKGLDFSKLSDSDPRAIKALAAIGDAWKNAPVDPKLNGKKIEIAGLGRIPLPAASCGEKEGAPAGQATCGTGRLLDRAGRNPAGPGGTDPAPWWISPRLGRGGRYSGPE